MKNDNAIRWFILSFRVLGKRFVATKKIRVSVGVLFGVRIIVGLNVRSYCNVGQ